MDRRKEGWLLKMGKTGGLDHLSKVSTFIGFFKGLKISLDPLGLEDSSGPTFLMSSLLVVICVDKLLPRALSSEKSVSAINTQTFEKWSKCLANGG